MFPLIFLGSILSGLSGVAGTAAGAAGAAAAAATTAATAAATGAATAGSALAGAALAGAAGSIGAAASAAKIAAAGMKVLTYEEAIKYAGAAYVGSVLAKSRPAPKVPRPVPKNPDDDGYNHQNVNQNVKEPKLSHFIQKKDGELVPVFVEE